MQNNRGSYSKISRISYFIFIIAFTFLISISISCSENKDKIEPEGGDIEKQIYDIHQIFLQVAQTQTGKEENNLRLIISLKEGKIAGKIIIVSENDISAGRSGTPACEGSGVDFIKCVKRIVDAGNCVVITPTCRYCAYVTDCPQQEEPEQVEEREVDEG